jgi:hypothetical protein
VEHVAHALRLGEIGETDTVVDAGDLIPSRVRKSTLSFCFRKC